MPAGLGFTFYGASNFGIIMSKSLLHAGVLSIESLVLMAVCSVMSNCVLYLLVVSIVVMSQVILCPVVREWWAGAD